jgi:hypothetical protein
VPEDGREDDVTGEEVKSVRPVQKERERRGEG